MGGVSGVSLELEDARVGLVGKFPEQEEVVAAKSVAVPLPTTLGPVEAGEGDAVVGLASGDIGPDRL